MTGCRRGHDRLDRGTAKIRHRVGDFRIDGRNIGFRRRQQNLVFATIAPATATATAAAASPVSVAAFAILRERLQRRCATCRSRLDTVGFGGEQIRLLGGALRRGRGHIVLNEGLLLQRFRCPHRVVPIRPFFIPE